MRLTAENWKTDYFGKKEKKIFWPDLLLLEETSMLLENFRKKNLIKTDENSYYWQRNSSYFLNNLRNFNEPFRKDVPYDNVKSHKKPGFHPLCRRYVFRKATEGRSIWVLLPQSQLVRNHFLVLLPKKQQVDMMQLFGHFR